MTLLLQLLLSPESGTPDKPEGRAMEDGRCIVDQIVRV
jgi:hypothetical protein